MRAWASKAVGEADTLTRCSIVCCCVHCYYTVLLCSSCFFPDPRFWMRLISHAPGLLSYQQPMFQQHKHTWLFSCMVCISLETCNSCVCLNWTVERKAVEMMVRPPYEPWVTARGSREASQLRVPRVNKDPPRVHQDAGQQYEQIFTNTNKQNKRSINSNVRGIRL